LPRKGPWRLGRTGSPATPPPVWAARDDQTRTGSL
jgi:hypothetical protein